MKKPNFEATFRRLLSEHEDLVRQHQAETLPEYKVALDKDLVHSREKVIRMFRTHEQNSHTYRDALKYILNESLDTPTKNFVRDILYPKKKVKHDTNPA